MCAGLFGDISIRRKLDILSAAASARLHSTLYGKKKQKKLPVEKSLLALRCQWEEEAPISVSLLFFSFVFDGGIFKKKKSFGRTAKKKAMCLGDQRDVMKRKDIRRSTRLVEFTARIFP